MYLLVHHLAIQDLEGVEVNALMEGEDGIADGGIIGQTEIFLRGTRGRGGMTMPVGENLQAVLSSVL